MVNTSPDYSVGLACGLRGANDEAHTSLEGYHEHFESLDALWTCWNVGSPVGSAVVLTTGQSSVLEVVGEVDHVEALIAWQTILDKLPSHFSLGHVSHPYAISCLANCAGQELLLGDGELVEEALLVEEVHTLAVWQGNGLVVLQLFLLYLLLDLLLLVHDFLLQLLCVIDVSKDLVKADAALVNLIPLATVIHAPATGKEFKWAYVYKAGDIQQLLVLGFLLEPSWKTFQCEGTCTILLLFLFNFRLHLLYFDYINNLKPL